MKKGDIIYFNKLSFIDNQEDQKQKRPCVYLFEEQREDGNYIYCIPLTSKVNTFNKHTKSYMLIPSVIYSYYKLNFANLEGIICKKNEEAHITGIEIEEKLVDIMLDRILELNVRKSRKAQYNNIKKLIEYMRLFELLEHNEIKKNNKKEKNERRRSLKRGNN